MPRLTPCPSCHSHVLTHERQCPHCGSSLGMTSAAARASVVLMGLALAGCPDDSDPGPGPSPDYGVPDTATASETEGTDDGDTADTDLTSAGEAEYGVAEVPNTTGQR